MIIEVIGYRGVVGNATYQWLRAMNKGRTIVGRDIGSCTMPKEEYMGERKIVSFVCTQEAVVEEVCEEAARYAALVVIRSTVKPGTCEALGRRFGVHVSHNPEFLREAMALQDIFNPEYVLIGACCERHKYWMKDIYSTCCCPVVVTDTRTSELVKLATNCYLTCLISYWNEIEGIAREIGVSGHQVGNIASHDPRVSKYGARFHHRFEGACLPKDLRQLAEYAEELGIEPVMLKAIEEVNRCQTSLSPSRHTMSKKA